ncbi:hypothetical protein [Actinopolymorpha pittospori]|uniref:Uncharacterized protein n=1 Tax=Actinopolymorpha pittospori TaxID=648752 RepID=A0A927R906_9ACTN|nr:hypothetical protein [Actinopolymorpha pittospori]MBE1603510.1 hypothetical protein [Actinopolymorpha pittospori]
MSTTTAAEAFAAKFVAIRTPVPGLTLVGEVIAPGLAITPAVGLDGFTGYWSLIHIRSGQQVNQFGFLDIDDLRAAAKPIIDAGISWDVPAGDLTDEARMVAQTALQQKVDEIHRQDQIQDHEAPFAVPAEVFNQPPPAAAQPREPKPGDTVRIGTGAHAGEVGVVVPSPDPSYWEGNIWVDLANGRRAQAYQREELTVTEADPDGPQA